MLQPYVKEDQDIDTIMLRTIRSLGYLEELYEWNQDGNFDRVSAMGMVMILRKERTKINNNNQREDDVYIEEDAFIKANFDDKMFPEDNLNGMTLFKDNKKYENQISKTENSFL